MYRIESNRRPDGRPCVRVELPMMPDPLLDILESMVGAIVRAVDPQAGPISFWVPIQSSSSTGQKPKSPGRPPRGSRNLLTCPP
jgi:hypothetical protein